MQCETCGKFCYGPRHLMREAMQEHRRLYHNPEEDKIVHRLIYPRI